MIVIENKADCSGCHACASICPQKCIRMSEDEQGFLYPEIDISACVDCKLCEKACHLKQSEIERSVEGLYAAKNKNIDERMSSSSGGIFVVVAKWIITKGGSVYGAAFDENYGVQHIRAVDMDGIRKIQTSKYVQSCIGDSYVQAKNDLESGKYVLFTGTPCQIGGFRGFLKKDYDKLFCQDIMCHGVPSPKVWRKYLDELRIGSVKNINFRDKSDGWGAFHVKIDGTKGSVYDVFNKNTYMRTFLSDASLRPSCYNCKYKHFHLAGDYTLADFWGVSDSYPDMDDDKGVSLFLVNTKKGRKILEEINASVDYREVDAKFAAIKNGAAINGAAMNEKNIALFKNIDNMSVHRIVEKYIRGSLWNRIKNKLIKKK